MRPAFSTLLITGVTFVLLSLFALSFPKYTSAAENFTTAYDIVYTIREDAVTNARLDVVLTNKTSQYFASSYTLQVGFDTIENVTANDESGQIAPKMTKNDTGTAIELKFNKKAVGINNSVAFSVTFDTPDVAKNQGEIWEINIPGVANPDEFSEYTVAVIPPPGLAQPTFIKPRTEDVDLVFTKDEVGKSGISIAYGDNRVFDYALTYHLKNSNIFPITTQIALPSTTNYQDVIIDEIIPAPSDVMIDEDGNWLATYHLAPSERADVVAKGKVKLSLQPKKEQLSDESRKKYLSAQRYWQVNDPKIQELAKKLRTPEKIYDFVVNTLTYDYSRVVSRQERLGALRALSDPDSAVCLEFSDLFITLARAADIPARELNGYAYTENVKQRPLSLSDDVLHAWPEYYDEKRQAWIMIDPTWGNTTGGTDYFHVFDFDHFVFVRKGMDSRYPIPAGGYKYEEHRGKKDVVIGFASDTDLPTEQLHVSPQTASIYASGLPITGALTVKNTGSVLAGAQSITVHVTGLEPAIQQIAVPLIPPHGKKEVAFAFDRTSFLTNGVYEFTIDHHGKTSYHTLRITPFVMTKFRMLGGVLIALLSIGVFIVAYETRRLRLSRRRK